MTERVNRRDLIVETASKLFVEQGYNGTSVRQIADEVGCTEAALYYHFKEGKRALLRSVIGEQLPNLMSVVDACREAQSLPELVLIYGKAMTKVGPPRMEKLRWLLTEFPKFSPEEQSTIHRKHIVFHDALAELIEQFVDDKQQADHMAWLMICAGFGYGQLFWNMNVQSISDFSVEDLLGLLAKLFEAGQNVEA